MLYSYPFLSLSKSTKDRLYFAIRTVLPSTICILLMTYSGFQWGALSYLSSIFAVIFSVMHLGRWQINCWYIMWSCFTGSLWGVIVGSTYQNAALHIVLFFLTTLWIDRCKILKQAPKTIMFIVFVISSLGPFLGASTSGGQALLGLMLLIGIPMTVVGIVTLFPYPVLGANDAKNIVRNLRTLVKRVTTAQILAFVHYDYVDVYNAEVDSIICDIRKEISLLTPLVEVVTYEAMIFTSLKPLVPFLCTFIKAITTLLVHILGQSQMLKMIISNLTHMSYVNHLEASLHGIRKDIDTLMDCYVLYMDALTTATPAVTSVTFESLMAGLVVSYDTVTDRLRTMTQCMLHCVSTMWYCTSCSRSQSSAKALDLQQMDIPNTTIELQHVHNAGPAGQQKEHSDGISPLACSICDEESGHSAGDEESSGFSTGMYPDCGPMGGSEVDTIQQQLAMICDALEVQSKQLIYQYHHLRCGLIAHNHNNVQSPFYNPNADRCDSIILHNLIMLQCMMRDVLYGICYIHGYRSLE